MTAFEAEGDTVLLQALDGYESTFPLEALHYIQAEPEFQLFMQVLQCGR